MHIFFLLLILYYQYIIYSILSIYYIFFVTQPILSRYLIKKHGTDKSRFIPFPRALIQSKWTISQFCLLFSDTLLHYPHTSCCKLSIWWNIFPIGYFLWYELLLYIYKKISNKKYSFCNYKHGNSFKYIQE